MNLIEYRFDKLKKPTSTEENIKNLIRYNILKLKRWGVKKTNIKMLLMLDNNLFSNNYKVTLSSKALSNLNDKVDAFIVNYNEYELTRVLLGNNLPLDFLTDFIFEPKYTIAFNQTKVIIAKSFDDICMEE